MSLVPWWLNTARGWSVACSVRLLDHGEQPLEKDDPDDLWWVSGGGQ